MANRKDICDCINSEDKELLLIAIDDLIQHEQEDIIQIRTAEERGQRLISKEKAGSDMYAFYKDTLNMSGRLVRIHEDRINSYTGVRTKLENTKDCD